MSFYTETGSGDKPLVNPLEMSKLLRTKDAVVAKEGVRVQANTLGLGGTEAMQLDWTGWLPFAATKYKISADPSDFLVVPVPIIQTDMSNRNGVGFPLKQLVMFNVEHGRQAYKTWKGKGTYLEHANSDPLEAKGIILDTFLRPIAGTGNKIYKLIHLLAYDRTKDPDLAKGILKGDYNSYSMGAWVESYTCSYCGAEIGKCPHLHPSEPIDFYMIGDKLVYRNVVNPVGFETSAVAVPAYTQAISDKLFSTGDKFGFNGSKRNEDPYPVRS